MGPQVVIDLETMSVESDASIASIGAVMIEGDSIIKEFYRTVDLVTCKEAGLKIDVGTINWWAQQNPEALKELRRNNVPLNQALFEFREWFGPKTLPVWGNGAGFDNVIMENAYKAIGTVRPWHWHHDRCYRTLASLFGFKKFNASIAGTQHNALDDAKWEAKQLMEFFNG
jgi:exodeoxyribonuclease VIII